MERDISEFLRTRRARLDPEVVGVPRSLTRRRVEGLRREEVALLAGVSPDYYVRLEQGRTGGISDQVLDSVARALQLSDHEREHLHNLAHPPRTVQPGVDRTADANLRRVVDALKDAPALLLDHRLDIHYWNTAAEAVFAVSGMGRAPNAARHLFCDAAAPLLYRNWSDVAADTVMHLRFATGRRPDDPALTSLIGELSIHSADFRRFWAHNDVSQKQSGFICLDHPAAGRLDFSYEMLTMPSHPNRVIASYLPQPGSITAERLSILLDWSTPN